jgi:hypothetical protein
MSTLDVRRPRQAGAAAGTRHAGFSVYLGKGAGRAPPPGQTIREEIPMEVIESRFLHAIDAAVEQALPAGWPRMPREWLPAHGSLRARHAFRLAPGGGEPRAAACRQGRTSPGGGSAPYLAILAAPPFPARTSAVQGGLAALVDRILSRGASLLLLFEHEDDPDGWIREQISCPHPRFLSLPCTPPAAAGGSAGDGLDYTVVPTAGRRETLAEAVRGLWSGMLRYRGPREGAQTLGVEIMADECWRCRRTLATVTGVVFPDREMTDWSRLDWAYYGQLLDLARIPDAMIPALSAAVDGWRAAGASCLTVIRWHFSLTVSHAYWAAECPFCGSFRGDFPVMEERSRWLLDLESRRTGVLSYRPLSLEVPRQALQELTWGWEVSPHCRDFGWYRAGGPELAAPEAVASAIGAVSGDPRKPADAGEKGGLRGLRPLLATHHLLRGISLEGPAASSPEARPLQRLGKILSAWLSSPRRVP